MPIIYTYPAKDTPVGSDLIVISDSEASNITKRATLSTAITNNQIKYDLNVTQDGLNVDLNLTSSDASDSSVVQFTAGTNVSFVRNSPSEITISASGGGNLPIEDEGTQITGAAAKINFTGGGVTATSSGDNVTVNIPGGSSGGTVDSVTTTDGTYINLTPNSPATGAVTIAADLSAIDGTSDTTTRFLSKDNTWDVPSYTNVTYTLTAPDANTVRLSDGSTNNDISLTAGTGVTLSQLAANNISFTNSDKGSSQNIYKNFAATTGGTAVASSNNDTLTLAQGTGITTTRSGNTITIAATSASSAGGGQTPVDYAIATGTDVLQAANNPTEYFYIFTCHVDFTLSKMYWYQDVVTSYLNVIWGIYQGDLSSATLLGKGTTTSPSVGINNVTITAQSGQNLNLTKGTTYVIAYKKKGGQGTVACKTNAFSNANLAVSSTSAAEDLSETFPVIGTTYSATVFRPCVSLVP